jgi:hypothetical protein
MRSPCCLCLPPWQLFNARANLHETWYVYHGTWAQLDGVKSLPSACVTFLSLPSKGSTKTLSRQWIHRQKLKNCWTRRFYKVSVVSKERRRLVLQRTSCNIILLSIPTSTKTSLSFRVSDQELLSILIVLMSVICQLTSPSLIGSFR